MKKLEIWLKDSVIWRTVFDVAKKEKRLKELEKEFQRPDLWKHPEGKPSASYGASKERAVKIMKELSALKQDLENWQTFKNELAELKELSKIADEKIEGELEEKIQNFEKKLEKEELQTFLSGKYDKESAILSIYARAGGQEAEDWATMLLRMYERYCLRKGFLTKILSQSFGEGGGPQGRIGTKQVSLEVKGPFAFGFLKKESGVHRLVRISPFSAQGLRHTSFALVEVIPELPKEAEKEIEIRPEDLKIDFYRASGPGGQYVNRRETAVRITHLPTGIVATCQSERLQGQNREKAMKILISKLYQIKVREQKEKIKKIKGKTASASWGNQIRSYVLHPYKLVKDLRTGIQTSNVEEILDGNLDEFITAEIKL